MSKRCQPAKGFGWLLLLGGLAACGYDVPWMAADAAGPGVRGAEEPDLGEAPDPYTPEVKTTGILHERYTKQGYGAAWTLQAADLDGDGVRELIYGGHALVAVSSDGNPLWTFNLPPENAQPLGSEEDEEIEEDEDVEEEDDREEPSARSGRGGSEQSDESRYAQKLDFLGPYVRAVKPSGGDMLVLDSLNRVHRVSAKDGTLIWSKQLEIEGNACDLAMFDGDGDGIEDFFPSGGTIAYSGSTGENLFEADIDFVPSIVAAADFDGNPGRELVLVAGAPSDVCPAEMGVIEAMEAAKGGARAKDRDVREGDPSPQPLEPIGEEDGGYGFGLPEPERDPDEPKDDVDEPKGDIAAYVLGTDGAVLFEGGQGLGEISAVIVAPMGGGRDANELVLANEDGLYAYGMDGVERWKIAAKGISDLQLADFDGDGNAELVALGAAKDTSTVYGIGGDGKSLFEADLGARAYTLAALDLDGDGKDELVSALGAAPKAPRGGEEMEENTSAKLVAYTMVEGVPTELWSDTSLLPARDFAFIGGAETNRLYVAGGDATLVGYDAATGERGGEWHAGSVNHAVGAGDLDGDGMAEVITGDIFGNLVINSGNGKDTTYAKLDVPSVVTGIAVSKNEAGNNILVASGYAWNNPDKGVLQGFDAEGNTLFSITNPDGIGDVKLADLDGNGTEEIVVARYAFKMDNARSDRGASEEGAPEPSRDEERDTEADTKGACGVLAYDIEGNPLFDTEVGTCDLARIEVGDIDGDGAFEIAYGELGKQGPYAIALLGGDGAVRFDVMSEANDAVWVGIVDGGLVYGGRADGDGGHVTLLDESGTERWTMDAGGGAENAPYMEESPFGELAGSLFGTAIGDIDGDDAADLAFTTAEGGVYVVSSNTGEPLYEAAIDGYVGGFVTYVGEGEEGNLVVSGFNFEQRRSMVLAFDLNREEPVGTLEIPGFIAGMVPATYQRGETGLALAGTYDTYGVNVDASTMPTPVTPRDDGSSDDGSGDDAEE